MLKAAASASHGEPSWNFTPLRSLNRQLVGLVCSQLSASVPMSCIVLGLRSTSCSDVPRMVWRISMEVNIWLSKPAGSLSKASTTFPDAVGPLGVGVAGGFVGVAGAVTAVGWAGAVVAVGAVAAGAGGFVAVGAVVGVAVGAAWQPTRARTMANKAKRSMQGLRIRLLPRCYCDVTTLAVPTAVLSPFWFSAYTSQATRAFLPSAIFSFTVAWMVIVSPPRTGRMKTRSVTPLWSQSSPKTRCMVSQT